jgi:hypothetical protein
MQLDKPGLSQTAYASPLLVTPSNSVDLAAPASGGLWVSGTGNVVLVCGGLTITLTGVAANTRLPFAATRVNATGTTATGIYALR